MDLREHDNVVECIEWAPDSAIENISNKGRRNRHFHGLYCPNIHYTMDYLS